MVARALALSDSERRRRRRTGRLVRPFAAMTEHEEGHGADQQHQAERAAGTDPGVAPAESAHLGLDRRSVRVGVSSPVAPIGSEQRFEAD
jgi:hypothetical protein